MTKLNQIIAVEKGVKTKAAREFTEIHHIVQKAPLLGGIFRTYQAKDEDGDVLPSESTLVQVKADVALKAASVSLTRLFDIELTKDTANASAVGNVSIDGKVIVANVPVTNLLFMEKQLTDLRTFMSKMPTLDPAEEWTHDTATGVWAATPVQTTRTKKVPRNHVKAPATAQHPAQVEMYHEDVIVGYWTTKKFSGALPAERVATLVNRVDRLIEAVKFAREEANSMEVTDIHAGKRIFDYLLAE